MHPSASSREPDRFRGVRPPPVPPAARPDPPAAPLPGWFLAVDAFVWRLHRTGFVQSLIVHMALLLLLAIVVAKPDPPIGPASLVLDFNGQLDVAVDGEPVALPGDGGDAAPTAHLEPEVFDVPAAAVHADAEPIDLASFEATDDGLPLLHLTAELPTAVQGVGLTGDVARRGRAIGTGSGPGGGAGISGELGQRLKAAGARSGDVQVSIAWNTIDDIDVHVVVEPLRPTRATPRSFINWTNRLGVCGGWLDVDANMHPLQLTDKPVENIFWGTGRAPFGRYTVAVHYYKSFSGRPRVPVEVAVLVDGREERFHPTVRYGDGLQVVAEFVRPIPR